MLDRKGLRVQWMMARGAERSFNTRLKQIAKQIGIIISGMAPEGVVHDTQEVTGVLEEYSKLILPWARAVSRYMIADVSRRNLRGWMLNGAEMAQALRAEIKQAPTGMLFSALMDEQVSLIQSLPLSAAKRVHELTEGALYSSARADVVAREILNTGNVTKARATLIARTEVSRTASNLTQARAMFAGSEGYIWRTSKDSDVRPTHQAQEGKYIAWNMPPKTDKGLDPYHAGCGPNCRCYPDPVLPDL